MEPVVYDLPLCRLLPDRAFAWQGSSVLNFRGRIGYDGRMPLGEGNSNTQLLDVSKPSLFNCAHGMRWTCHAFSHRHDAPVRADRDPNKCCDLLRGRHAQGHTSFHRVFRYGMWIACTIHRNL